MSTVGSLRVTLGLDSAQYTAGLTKAEAQATKFAATQARNSAAIDRQVASLQKQAAQLGMSTREVKLSELAHKGATTAQLASADAALRQAEAFKQSAAVGVALGLAVVAAGAGLVALTKHAIDSADALNDASKKTGIAATTIGGIGFAAEQAGSNLEQMTPALGKLNKSIAEAAAGGETASEAFSVMGISVKDSSGNVKDAGTVLAEVAGKFSGYEDGATKVALAQRIFGKSGADLIPLLDEGRASLEKNIETYKQYSGVTDELVQKSDGFNDVMAKVGLVGKSLGNQIASELLPLLTSLAEAFADGGQFADVFSTAAKGIRVVLETVVVIASDVVFTLKGVGREIGAIAAQAVALSTLDIKGFNAISDAVKEDGERARKELDAFQAKVMGLAPGQGAFVGPAVPEAKKKKAPGLKAAGGGGGASKAEQELKKRLDGQLQAERDFARDQAQVYDFAERLAQGRFDAGVTSLAAFFSEQQTLRDAALAAQVASLDKEIALQQQAAGKLTGTHRIDLENKIAESVRNRAKVVEIAGQAEQLAQQQQAASIKQTQRQYDDLRASVLALSGDEAAASKIRIAAQVEEARKTITAAGGDPGVASQYEAQLTGAEGLRAAQEKYNRLLDQTAMAEEKILLAAQQSGTGEIETLTQVGTVRAAALKQLGDLAKAAAELALSVGTPEAIAFAERLSLAFQKASADVDPLLTKMKAVGAEVGSSIAQGFEAAALEGKGLRDVLKGIEKDLLRIVTRELVTKPFEGMLSGLIGGFATGAMGQQQQAAPAASGGGGGGWLQAIGSIASAYFMGGSGGASSGGGGGAFVGPPAPARAGGGMVKAGGMYEVAENRPEMLDVNGRKFLLMGKQRGNIDPNPQQSGGGGGVNANIVVQMPSGTTSRTMNQAGAAVARQLSIASRRNG